MKRIFHLNRTSSTNHKMDSFERLKAQGNSCYQQQDYAGALRWYDQCLEADATNPIAHSNRAMCLIKLNRSQEAQKACQAGLALLRTSPGIPNLERLHQKLEYRLQLAQQLLQGSEATRTVETRTIPIQTVEQLPQHLATL